MIHRVFVYGSLLRGLHNDHYLRGATYIGPGRTAALLRMVSLRGFPGVYQPDEGEPGEPILGEIYDVTSAELARLDQLEGNGRFYTRDQRGIVRLGDADGDWAESGDPPVACWVYLLPKDRAEGLPVVEGGDWRAYLEGAGV